MTSRQSTFLSGLTGVLVGALLVGAGPSLAAAVGDPLRLGRSNTVSEQTTVKSPGAHVFALENTGTGKGLKITTAAGKAPLTVNRPVRVANLNADMVDGRHASAFQLHPPVVFVAGSELVTISGDATHFQNLMWFPAGAPEACGVTQIDLPEGATITSFAAVVYDGSNTGNVSALLFRANPLDSGTGNLASVETTDAGTTPTETRITQGGLTFPVDLAYTYGVKVCADGGAATVFERAEVTYTM
jgi:hypothetical protein